MKIDIVEPGFEFPRKEHCPQSLYDDQLKYFVDCIEKKQNPIPGGIEGWMNMKVVESAYESSKTGKVVNL
jgi:predicted dehydrogenase